MKKDTLVSVVMPVYNGERFLDEAIQSILNQTYQNFEFIIINDGSKDRSLEIIEKYKDQDKRIVLISRENRGLVTSLNEGIEKAKGKYIARMDADDISLSHRFEKQVDLLEKNSKIDIVGCNYQLIDENSKIKGEIVKVPIKSNDIIATLCYSVPFAHPSVMIKKNIFKNFSYEDSPTEDYLLWTKTFTENNFANIDKVLLQYRHQYGESFSDSKRIQMLEAEKNISKSFIIANAKLLTSIFNNKLNQYKCRAISNIIVSSGIKVFFNIIGRNKIQLSICSLKYVVRHFIRVYFWKLKN